LTLPDRLDYVGSVRCRGLMGGVELVADKATKKAYPFEQRTGHKVIVEAPKQGVILRPLGDVIVLMPPLAISTTELEQLFAVTEQAIKAVCGYFKKASRYISHLFNERISITGNHQSARLA